MDEYEKLLERGHLKLPESVLHKERFEISKVIGHLQGNKTVISNFSQICSMFRRDQNHLLKYLQRELATPAYIDGPRLILGRKLSSSLINNKIERYAKQFVLCPECGKPDTQLVKEERVTLIKCSACGAKHPVKTKI
ncbi:translation initiation factor IF-2 subunit beta [Candidatus Woesearchaeota archaeon]|nr:translation initiation factor IF-2 subunit beta [Candidatus Woesearchaeota archaeon]